MSAFDAEEGKREIIIVRRGGGDHEEGHHGGVWKIAFADFMTALMCFFLVMWLVNATNEDTKAAIASYFNPMTLVDTAPASKGLDDPGESSTSPESSNNDTEESSDQSAGSRDQRSGPGEHANSIDQSADRKTSDQHLFSDPYAVLAEIAAQTATLQNVSAKGDGGAQTSGPATGAQGGESYRDPFAPDFWSQEIATAEDAAELDVFRTTGEQTQPAEEGEQAEQTEAAVAMVVPSQAAAETAPSAEAIEQPVAPAEPEQLLNEEGALAETTQLAEQIRQEISDAFGRESELNSTISVVAEADGILISVTDELNYGMFEIGSAVPQGQLVLAMEEIGRTLSQHEGTVRINGHTDGRPFRNAEYDNWRLSTARAHAAYYMLVRGGLAEDRIGEVAGFADRKLKVADDPLDDANRRIEIFVEVPR
ncbi:MotB family protein [Neoaquamicrobium sediminum]|uniref:MotB family protein n=1 Tax=Neoaquamicrobium sediminum TaxID=1849104 RepID=A0ABV3WZH6_9HYPH